MRLRIAFLASSDPTDKKSWSGILYYMLSALQKHCGNVEILTSLTSKLPINIGGIFSLISRKTNNKRFDYYHMLEVLIKNYNRIIMIWFLQYLLQHYAHILKPIFQLFCVQIRHMIVS